MEIISLLVYKLLLVIMIVIIISKLYVYIHIYIYIYIYTVVSAHRWKRNPRPLPQRFSKLVSLIEFSQYCIFLNWRSGALVRGLRSRWLLVSVPLGCFASKGYWLFVCLKAIRIGYWPVARFLQAIGYWLLVSVPLGYFYWLFVSKG